MQDYDVIIIGAGASGLAAAFELSKVNRKVLLLEAKDRIGGRVHTLNDASFSLPVEAGAEFIHGKLPHTLNLLKKAGLTFQVLKGKMWRVQNSHAEEATEFIDHWEILMQRLKTLQNDMTIADFLDTYFPEDTYQKMKQSVYQFVQGYDAADAHKASALALRSEWETEDEGHQYRIDKGYTALMNFLVQQCTKAGQHILLSHAVNKIHWQKGIAEVYTTSLKKFTASKVLLTLSLGVWQAPEGSEGTIAFTPSLPQKLHAAQHMGFGSVIKFAFQFRNEFWEEDAPHPLKDTGFIFSDAVVPTWWTQHPHKTGMLTGWLAGPAAAHLKAATQQTLLEKALESLAFIFGVEKSALQQKVTAHKIFNWSAEPFINGAYSYATLDTKWAKKIMQEAVQDTLFFAGEALSEGAETGTVESALAHGTEVAQQIIASDGKGVKQ